MLRINFTNIEDLILKDGNVQKLLPAHLFSYFEQWKLVQHVPALKQESKQTALDLLDALEDHTEILEKYFGETVIVEKLNYHAVWNLKVPIEDEEEFCRAMCQMDGYGSFSTWRDEEFLYVSFWR